MAIRVPFSRFVMLLIVFSWIWVCVAGFLFVMGMKLEDEGYVWIGGMGWNGME